MKIIHRLYLTIAPSAVAIALLAALLYWGRYGRTAPEAITVLAGIVVLVSIVVSWANARSVARRLERLVLGSVRAGRIATAGSLVDRAAPPSSRDELDEIEQAVDSLSGAVNEAATDRTEQTERYERQLREYAGMLGALAHDGVRQLNEIRLPLHILLENHFGDLNENQEEMIGSARQAAEALDVQLASIAQIAAFDLGDQPIRRDRIKPSDLVSAIRPMLVSTAEALGLTMEFDVEPLLPSILGDRPRLQRALVTIARAVLATAGTGARVQLSVRQQRHAIVLGLDGGTQPERTTQWTVAERVVRAHDGQMAVVDHHVAVTLPLP